MKRDWKSPKVYLGISLAGILIVLLAGISFNFSLTDGFVKQVDSHKPNSRKQQSSVESRGIQCSVSIRSERWSKTTPAKIQVNLTNHSGKVIKLDGLVELNLVKSVNGKEIDPYTLEGQRNEFGSVTAISEAISVSGQQGREPEELQPNETKLIEIDPINSAGWDQAISSTIRRENLFTVVPDGEYQLTVTVLLRKIDEPVLSGAAKKTNAKEDFWNVLHKGKYKIVVQAS